jgi:hypothetical protein
MNSFSTVARRVAAIAAVSALGFAAFAPAALADSNRFTDARGDIAQGADIQAVRVFNSNATLRVNVKHRDLVRSFRSGSSISVFLDTDPARRGPEFVFTGATFSGGDYALLPARGFRASSDTQVPLHGGSYLMRLDYARDIARITIDQVVLGSPAAVRVEVKTGAEGVGQPNEVDWLGTPRSFTPRVERG